MDKPPHGLSTHLQGAPQDAWMLGLRRLLWEFIRDAEAGLPSSTLLAKTEWHPQLLTNLKKLLSTTEGQFGLKAADRLGNKLAKTGLSDLPLTGAVEEKDRGPGIRVETIHQVKGESIGAVLYVTKKPNVDALLAGTLTEEGRIGYVAVTRARNLFWLAVPHTCLKALRPNLIAADFEEVPARK